MLFVLFFTTILSWSLLEPFAYNFMMDGVSKFNESSSDIVIIAIDDKSISYHRWPWPRGYYADIINYLNTYSSPKVIGFDTIIQSYDKENPASDIKYFDAVKNTDNLVVGFSALSKGAFSEDRNKEYNKKFNEKFKTDIMILNPNAFFKSSYTSLSEYPEKYFDVVKNTGSVNVDLNTIGYVTYANLLVAVGDKYYPSLALKMYMYANNAEDLTLYPDKLTVNKTGLTIPVFSSYKGLYNYLKFFKFKDSNNYYTHTYYSASDILKSVENIKIGKPPIIDPKVFDNKYVFIGANAKAAALGLEDALQTPISNKQPGVDIQATNLDNILNNGYMKTPPLYQNLLAITLMFIIAFIVICNFSVIKSLIILLLISLIYFAYSIFCFKAGIIVDIVTPIAIEFVTTVFGYSYRFIVEGRNKEKIKQAMGKYISQDVMKNVVQNIDDVKLGGKRAVVTVLFSDIRGFTSMSEKMSAEDVSIILNEYFSEMEPIITKYNGVINKFIGDAVMAIFGEPIQDLNHPVNAVKCAYEMLKKVEELQDKWLFEGKPKIEIGIGINTGEAFVGNIGSEKRLEYTVIGDTVNLASRIEGYNKVYHTNFLVSSSTYKYISDIADVIKISDVSIRGKSKKMDIYEVLKLNKK